MVDVQEIVDYMKHLKRGFDIELYQKKIDHLSNVAETVGLDNNDLHTLFKIWLNLSIPFARWTSLGVCLIPQDIIGEQTVDYAFLWILAVKDNPPSFPRIAFLLDWLTAAMDCNCIDMEALDSGYEIFYSLLTYDLLIVHATKLVYTLMKPVDVTRKRVIQILDFIKKREAKKNWLRQLQVILGLFKSYKPEFVPEDVPAISIHMVSGKLNAELLRRFEKRQNRRLNEGHNENQFLLWMNPVNSYKSRNKNADPLVPNMAFHNVGSKQYADKKSEKTHLDFADPRSLVQYSLHHNLSRPAKLRALLCNETGITLLAVASSTEYYFFSHDLYQLLNMSMLELSPYTYVEKRDLLQRLAMLQGTLMRGVPVVTRFLAQYLALWNERDYFHEILELVEWISVDNPDQVALITGPLARFYHRARPMEQCAILRCLTNAYCNLLYVNTRGEDNFMGMIIPQENYTTVLQRLASDISAMSEKALQVDPDDICVLYTSLRSVECRTATEMHCSTLGAPPGRLTLALPMVGISAHLLDKMAGLMLLYKKLFKKCNTQSTQLSETLHSCTKDMTNCLYNEQAITDRKNGTIFSNFHPQLVARLMEAMPDIDSKFSIRNSLAFMPYAPLRVDGGDAEGLTNKEWFDTVIKDTFKNLARFLMIAVYELRS